MVDPGKRERLRKGEYVELEPGVHGRLNSENRTLELSSGKILPISEKNQRDLFPENEQRANIARKKEGLEKEIEESPLGEFGYQFGQNGIANAAKNWIHKYTKTDEDYLQTKQAESEVSGRISEESPYTSAGAKAASFVPDIYATGGMSALKAAPLLAAAHAGPRIIEEPLEVAKEASFAAGGGFLLDKAHSFLNKVAARRAASRSLPGEQAAVRAQNVAGEAENAALNLQQKQNFNALKSGIKSQNELAAEEYQFVLEERKNSMIQAKNDYEVAKFNRSSTQEEISRLSNEFKASQKAYDESLKELPKLQRKAQEEYSASVIKNSEKISNSFPQNSKISSSQFGVSDYIDEAINKSGLAGTKQGRQASNILNSLFPEGEIISGRELSKRYSALESSIQKSSGEVRGALVGFKDYIGEKIPTILADNMAYTKIVPALKTEIQRDVEKAIESMGLKDHGIGSKSFYLSKARSNVDQLFREISPDDFMEKFQSGEIKQLIKDRIMTKRDFDFSLGALKNAEDLGKAKRNRTTIDPKELQKYGIIAEDSASKNYSEFMLNFDSKLNKSIGNAERKMIATDIDAQTKLGRSVQKTYGMAGEVAPPEAPLPPNMPQLPGMPQMQPVSPYPGKPAMLGMPEAPQPNIFNPTPEPTLAPASGMAEQAGDFLEKKLLGGKSLTNNPVAKLAGLKYALGGAALPAEALYGGAKLLTSPTAAGEGARMGFKQGGIQFIDQMARKYPSYNNGILNDPRDRRSLTKEIEDDYEIPAEEKAMIQSKVNRGRPLEAKLN